MPPNEPGDSAMTEQRQFEEAMHPMDCIRRSDDTYADAGIRLAWFAWQARALLSTPDSRASIAQPVPVSEPIYQVVLFGTDWTDTNRKGYDYCSKHTRRVVYAAPPQAVVAQPVDEAHVIAAIKKACGEYRIGVGYSYEDVWNVVEVFAQSPQAKAVETPPCKGMNCGCTDGASHSPECQAEHAAAVAGGSFVKVKSFPPMTYEDWAHGEGRCQSCKLNREPNCPHNSQAKAGDKS